MQDQHFIHKQSTVYDLDNPTFNKDQIFLKISEVNQIDYAISIGLFV